MSERSSMLIEPTPIMPTYVEELAAVVPLGSVTHLIFAHREPDYCSDGAISRVVQARLIVPTDQLVTIAKALTGPKPFLDNRAEEALLN
jgi:hypothetical protein